MMALMTGLFAALPSVQAEPVYCYIDGCMQEVSVTVTPATCTKDGTITFTCPVHGTRTEAGASAQHNYRKDAGSEIEADCLHSGTYTETCIECQDTRRVDDPDIPALGHELEYREEQLPEDGREGMRGHYVCSRCGSLFSDENGLILTNYLRGTFMLACAAVRRAMGTR